VSAAGQKFVTVKVEGVAEVIVKTPSFAEFFIPVTKTVVPCCSAGPVCVA